MFQVSPEYLAVLERAERPGPFESAAAIIAARRAAERDAAREPSLVEMTVSLARVPCDTAVGTDEFGEPIYCLGGYDCGGVIVRHICGES